MRTGGDEVGDAAARVAAGDQGLADQDDVGAGAGELDHVVRSADAGLGDPDDRRRGSAGRAGEGGRGRPRGSAGCGR